MCDGIVLHLYTLNQCSKEWFMLMLASVYSKQYLPTAKRQYHIRAIRKLCGACVTAFLWAAKNTHLHYIYPTGPAGSCLIQKYLLLPITLDGKPSSHTALAQHSTFCTSLLLGGIAICHPMSTWWNAGNTGSFPCCSWMHLLDIQYTSGFLHHSNTPFLSGSLTEC